MPIVETVARKMLNTGEKLAEFGNTILLQRKFKALVNDIIGEVVKLDKSFITDENFAELRDNITKKVVDFALEEGAIDESEVGQMTAATKDLIDRIRRIADLVTVELSESLENMPDGATDLFADVMESMCIK